MGIKYQAESVRADAITRLKTRFPSSLEKLELSEAKKMNGEFVSPFEWSTSNGKIVARPPLLQESLDMQRLLQEEDAVSYRAMQAELAADNQTEVSGNTRRKRSQFPRRKSFKNALAKFPLERVAATADELSDDDEEFAPDPAEADEETSDDEASDLEEPAPKRKRN